MKTTTKKTTFHDNKNMKNEMKYTEQAQAFLERFGIKFTATLTDTKQAPWADEQQNPRWTTRAEPHHYRVTLSKRRARHTTHCTFDFWGSIADAEANRTAITPYDVLACISGDTYCADTFEDWCCEMGDSTDSRKAEQTYRRCAAFAKRLQAFFNPEEVEALQEIQ